MVTYGTICVLAIVACIVWITGAFDIGSGRISGYVILPLCAVYFAIKASQAYRESRSS